MKRRLLGPTEQTAAGIKAGAVLPLPLFIRATFLFDIIS